MLEACQGGGFRAAVSELVLIEARVNIAEKFGETELVRFYRQLSGLDPEIVQTPSIERIQLCVSLTTEKDAHVLAAALDCGADYLLTLDRRHLLNERVLGAGLPVRPMTPGDFLQGPSAIERRPRATSAS